MVGICSALILPFLFTYSLGQTDVTAASANGAISGAGPPGNGTVNLDVYLGVTPPDSTTSRANNVSLDAPSTASANVNGTLSLYPATATAAPFWGLSAGGTASSGTAATGIYTASEQGNSSWTLRKGPMTIAPTTSVFTSNPPSAFASFWGLSTGGTASSGTAATGTYPAGKEGNTSWTLYKGSITIAPTKSVFPYGPTSAFLHRPAESVTNTTSSLGENVPPSSSSQHMMTSQHSPSSDMAPAGNVNTAGIMPFAGGAGCLRLYVATLAVLSIGVVLLNLPTVL